MLYLGIDIAKHKHYASIMDSNGNPVEKPFPVYNHRKGGQALLKKIYQHIDAPTEIKIGMEATGHYWLALYSFFVRPWVLSDCTEPNSNERVAERNRN